MDDTATRQLYLELQPGDKVEVVHQVKIGSSANFAARTVGTVVDKYRREAGLDSGFRRAADDKYWFDHLLLRDEDGQLTSVTMDEFTQLRRLS